MRFTPSLTLWVRPTAGNRNGSGPLTYLDRGWLDPYLSLSARDPIRSRRGVGRSVLAPLSQAGKENLCAGKRFPTETVSCDG